MMRRHRIVDSVLLGAVVAAAAVVTAGCSSSVASPATPSASTTTESFDGSLAQSGTGTHPFTVSARGMVTISLTAVSPLTTMALGVGLGTWDGTTCSSQFADNKDARAGATALTGTAAAGSYCIRVYDSGNIPADWSVAYSIDVVHP
jgi:hypothetical protein